MTKLLFALTVLFGILTFIGAGYVLYSHGQANAGYAVIPCLWCIIFSQAYRRHKEKMQK